MNVVFLDTVGLLALWSGSDQWHGAAETAFSGLLHCQVFTNDVHFRNAGFEVLF